MLDDGVITEDALQTLTDLNDFITPSQACIKPVEQTNKPDPLDPGAAAVSAQYMEEDYVLRRARHKYR